MFKGKVPVILVLVLFLGACSKAQKTSSKVVRINLVDEPHTLDPRCARDPHAQMLMRMFFEGLTRIGPGEKPQLALAQSVVISEDFKTYTFTLRKALWTNGDQIKASDFVYSWRKILSPDFISDNAYQLYVLKNAKEAKEGYLSLEKIGVSAPDDRTLVLEIEYPTPYLLELLAMPFFFPVNERIAEANPKWANDLGSYVTCGPFSLKSWRHQSQIEAIKNPLYWDADQVKIDGVSFIMVESNTEMKLFDQKSLHWMGSPLSTISVDAIPYLKKKGSILVKPRAETAFLRVNTSRKILQEAKVRQALALAINRASITEHVLQGGQLPAMRLVPPTMQLQKSSYFKDGAKEDALECLIDGVAKLGASRDDLADLTLLYIHSERGHLIAQAIQQQWHDAFGVRIALEGTERKVYFDRISHHDYDLAFCSWGADFHDPVNFLEVFKYKNQSTNNTDWENANYRSILDSSFIMASNEERAHLLGKCEQILMDEMPIIPLFHYTMLYQKDPKLEGVFLSSLGHLDFKWATLQNED